MVNQFIRIINWERFQHYKDRNPPWIKLHRELLTSRTWITSDDTSRALAIACMVLAAETGNSIPFDPVFIKRRAYLNQEPDFAQLLAAQFIEIIDESGNASSVLAGCKQVARPETETETEGEKRQKRASAHSRVFHKPSFDELKAYCQERQNGVDSQEFLDHYEANGWKVGRNPMKDWRAAVRTWEQRRQRDTKPNANRFGGKTPLEMAKEEVEDWSARNKSASNPNNRAEQKQADILRARERARADLMGARPSDDSSSGLGRNGHS